MGFIDFAAVKEAATVEEVCLWYSLALTKEQSTLRGCCPVCKSDDKRAFTVTPAKHVWHCHKCKAGGDTIALVAAIENVGVRNAAQLILDKLEKRHVGKPDTPPGELKPLDYLQPSHEAVQTLGIPEDLAKRVGIGFANKGTMASRVCIPVRDPTGKLLFYIGYHPDKPLRLPKL